MDMLLNYLHSGLSAIIPFIILLGLLIFVHELGHFLVAKFWGVRVEVFSMGFGKKIFKYKRGDTTYALSLIPLGGYVKMFGDELNAQVSEQDRSASFTHKPVWQRISVVLAGPLMNFFFAILIFMIVALVGEQMKAPIAGDVASDSPAYQMGFRSGDKIVKAGGQNIQTWDQLVALMTENHGQTLQVDLQREGSDRLETIQATPTLVDNQNVLSLDAKIGDIEGLSTSAKASLVGVRPASTAAKAGLETGDLIKSVGGRPIKYFRELENLFVSQQGQPFSVEVERFESVETNKSKILKIDIPATRFASLRAIGIEASELYLAKIIEDSPARAAGLKPGDRILAVNQVAPSKWEDILQTVKAYEGDKPLSFEVEHTNGEISKIEITPRMTSQMTVQGGEEKRFTIGIIPWAFPALPMMSLIKATSLSSAFTRGVDRTLEITKMTVVSFVRLIQAKISPKNIGGVISIGQAASETFKQGLSQYLQMMAIISVNLFILNLLPVPVLDGGHLLFYVIEALKGAPVSMRKMEIAQQIGLVVLMSLMVFALFNDFTRILGSW
jgi:regulator of sigma E protease